MIGLNTWMCFYGTCRHVMSDYVQATHWNHGDQAERIRMDHTGQAITQRFWTSEFNRILTKEYRYNTTVLCSAVT